MLLNLNAVMSIIANVPAAVASTVSSGIYIPTKSHFLDRLWPVVPFAV